jgi:hypothetical protein
MEGCVKITTAQDRLMAVKYENIFGQFSAASMFALSYVREFKTWGT